MFFFYFLRISLLCEGSLAFYLRRTVCISLHFIHAYKRASLEINRGVKDASALRETITMRVPAKTRDCRGSLKDERRASSLRTRTKHRRLKRTGTTRFTKNTWKNKLHSVSSVLVYLHTWAFFRNRTSKFINRLEYIFKINVYKVRFCHYKYQCRSELMLLCFTKTWKWLDQFG